MKSIELEGCRALVTGGAGLVGSHICDQLVQAGAAELIAPGRYRLTRLLRGLRGTEHAMGNPAPAGARVVVLDTALASLPIAEADLGLPWNWRVGPAARSVSDASYTALGFTPTGRGLVPFAPVHVEQPWRTARSPNLTDNRADSGPALPLLGADLQCPPHPL